MQNDKRKRKSDSDENSKRKLQKSTTDDDTSCRWCGATKKDVQQDFAGEFMMKAPCCEENVCTHCVCIASQKLRDKVKKSHHPIKTIYCEHCQKTCINTREFPQNPENQNYKQICGFLALFWIENSFLSHNRNRRNRKHWWLARPTRIDICSWLWEINNHVLKNCLFRDGDDTLFETLQNLFKNVTPKKEESHSSGHLQRRLSHIVEVAVTNESNFVKIEPPEEEKEEEKKACHSGHVQRRTAFEMLENLLIKVTPTEQEKEDQSHSSGHDQRRLSPDVEAVVTDEPNLVKIETSTEDSCHSGQVEYRLSYDTEATVTDEQNLIKIETPIGGHSGHVQHDVSSHTAELAVTDSTSIGKFIAEFLVTYTIKKITTRSYCRSLSLDRLTTDLL